MGESIIILHQRGLGSKLNQGRVSIPLRLQTGRCEDTALEGVRSQRRLVVLRDFVLSRRLPRAYALGWRRVASMRV
jgi:hypothetical protein